MGIFTKKSAKRKSDKVDEISDAWLMGESDEENVNLDSLDYLESLNLGPAPDPASEPPGDVSRPPAPVTNPEANPGSPALGLMTDSPTDGWHLPDVVDPIPPPNAQDRRADDEPAPSVDDPTDGPQTNEAAIDDAVTNGAPTEAVAISAADANADFLAVDLPNCPENDISSVEPIVEQPSAPTGPTGPQAATLLEILGLAPGSSWETIRDAHQEHMRDHDESTETDPSRVALGRAIKREMNTAYAALRLMAVE